MKILAKKDNQDHLEWFTSIADELMNKWSLRVDKIEYRLTEIEFYFFDADYHPDPYVHKNDRQLSNGQWYFHGSGLDITFGDKSRKAYGGILIRGIQNVDTEEYINGSLKLLSEIFKQFGMVSSHSNDFGLAKAKHAVAEPVACPRVGLNPIKDETYSDKPYRFIIGINPDHHFKEKTNVSMQMAKDNSYTKDEINKMFGYTIIK